MTRITKFLGRVAHELERQIESRRIASRDYHAETNPIFIETYRSYGTKDRLRVRGRVLEGTKLATAAAEMSKLSNLVWNFRRFSTREIAGAVVSITIGAADGGEPVEAMTNPEGYFDAVVPNRRGLEGWVECEVALVTPRVRDAETIAMPAYVLVPRGDAAFGVISDLDDTVIESNVTSRIRMLKTVLFENARSRMPFEGVAEFYSLLHAGGRNPIFYVSGGPWNLYELYHDFLDAQQIPHGPLLLADFGLEDDMFIHPAHHEHKGAQIRDIIDTYPTLRFVLIGDSGEQDPEIYLEMIRTHPGRILAVYIRNVRGALDDARLGTLAAEATAAGVPYIGVTVAAAAIDHAREQRLIV